MNGVGSLREITKFKREIIGKILANENLGRLLIYTSETPYTEPAPTSPSEMLYRNVFPYVFAGPQTQQNIESYIMLEFICEGVHEAYIKMGVLAYFYCHKNIMLIKDENNESKVRRDAIMEELFLSLRRENWGIGPLVFKSLQPAYGLGSDYIGSCMIFETRTFQSSEGNTLNPYSPPVFDDEEWEDEEP